MFLYICGALCSLHFSFYKISPQFQICHAMPLTLTLVILSAAWKFFPINPNLQMLLQCTWCRAASLCSEACLRLHRPLTKCLPVRAASVQGKGRGLVASRDIRARETILTEAAALTGPSLVTGKPYVFCFVRSSKNANLRSSGYG